MPTYDYICANCDAAWELFQSIKASPVRKCPECGKLKAKRQIGTGSGVIFKGSGFYETDYRSASYKKGVDAAQKAEKAASSENKKSDTKGESKSTSTKKKND
ncbi:MAG: zinc ribbon domain-containing protein [Planctomycetaceae bacterium]|nr:zinc ribbon domain-containing protein [Planctomycetaceae bacterium]